MDFYDATSCRQLGLPCPQSQSGLKPSQTVTPMAASSNNTTPAAGATIHQTTTPRNIDFSKLSRKETCFGGDDGDGNESSQLDQQLDVTTLSYVSHQEKIRNLVPTAFFYDYFYVVVTSIWVNISELILNDDKDTCVKFAFTEAFALS